jgi:histidinol phosphatase-like enzyme
MNLNLAGSYFVGDAASDLVAARQVDCQAFLVLTGRGFQQLIPALQSVGREFTLTRNLMNAANHILISELKSTNKTMSAGIPVKSQPAWINVAPEK